MKRKLKREHGITLVVLVITIIILLILAGIAIATLTQTGLFENAKQAKNITDNSQVEENKTLISYEEKIESINSSNREENNKNSNINIYVNDEKIDTIPSKDSNYIFTKYTTSNEDTSLEFDMINYKFNIYNLTDSSVEFNLYFYEKDSIAVVLKLLNCNEKYDNKADLCNEKFEEIVKNKVVYDYILNSKGEMAEILVDNLDSGNFASNTVEAYVDGNNTHNITLNPGKYIIKLTCNKPFKVNSLLADGNIIEPIKENVYVCEIKNKVTINWYCNYVGVHKYLYIKYKKY